VPPEIHTLMQDAHDQDSIVGLPIEHRMARGFYLAIATPDIARVASEVRKFDEPLECFMLAQDIFFGPGEAPLPNGEFGNGLNILGSLNRQPVATHARSRGVPSPRSKCPEHSGY